MTANAPSFVPALLRTGCAAMMLAAALPTLAADTGVRAHKVAPIADASARPDKVARGKYLVTIAGCNDCHTPWKPGPEGPAPDMTRMLSGHPETLSMPP